ncbi:MAG: right-handed parallel beta-helix repeat-containing protein [Rhodobacter sp.]|nr:right-handed parallel beta-helix repeat-containing protein [Rhodobacter sp.]MCA3517934.1 right-handed parallel beta-helix repeat-containing protein [Rhodobacter sp.]MCA6229739.1 right-handed parallel beta-helix repeat-containing protein [Phenylobacterium sp.]
MGKINPARKFRKSCGNRHVWGALRQVWAVLFLASILGAAGGHPAVAQAERDDVLVLAIGNTRYKTDGRSDAPDVPFAGKDALAFSELWTEFYGLASDQVVVRENVTLSNLRALFGTAGSPAGQLHKSVPRSVRTVIVFFSGHGVPGRINSQGEVRSQPFLLPVDGTAAEPEQTAYPLQELVAALGRLQVDNVILVLDACFTGLTPAPEATMVEGSSASFGVAFAAVEKPPKVSILSATSREGNQIANWLDERQHGAFTWHLLEGLRGAADRDRDRDLTLQELFIYVGDRLSVGNLQQPLGRAQNPNLDPPQADLLLAVLPEKTPGSDGVLTVKPDGSGEFRTIAEAVASAKAGDRVEIHPGRYLGGVVVDKAIEIVGIGKREDILWEAKTEHVIKWTAGSGRIANLTMRQIGVPGDEHFGAVDFQGGSALIEGNDLTSSVGSIVHIRKTGADPVVRGNTLRDGKAAGIFVYDNGKGRIEENQIFGNVASGIVIGTGADPVVRGNTLRDGRESGIHVNNNGKGRIEENQIFRNALSGIEISTGADPVVRGNTLRDGKAAGIFVYDNGKGRIEENQIFGNAYAGIAIETGADPFVRGNTVRDGKQGGIWVYDNGMGRIEENQIFGNAWAGIQISTGADPVVRGNTLRDGRESGIHVYNNGKGRIEENQIFGNALAGIEIKTGADPVVRGNRVTTNKRAGILIVDGGQGEIVGNDLRGNGGKALDIRSTAGKVKARDNQQ